MSGKADDWTMLYSKINIWDGFTGDMASDIGSSAVLVCYVADDLFKDARSRGDNRAGPSGARKPAVLVCPGGAYSDIAEREGEPVALAFLARGFNAFVLKYEVPPRNSRQPLLDVSRAVCLIRDHAEAWLVDANRIAVCGFSAGGHLAASLGVFWKDPVIQKMLGIDEGKNKPDALILCYAVITSEIGKSNRGSFDNLFGGNQDDRAYESMSLEKHVNQETPPAFIWHTFDDISVPVDNALLFAQSLRNNHVPFEMHIFPGGPHGLALCDERTDVTGQFLHRHAAVWFDLCIAWLQEYAFEEDLSHVD
jgi:acetyl esterase/lipase